jgi:23S rRNA (uracil1939-C5)-methyltransferase
MPQLEIETMTIGPFGVGHSDGKAVMVPNVAVGDSVEVRILTEHRDYSLAELVQILKPGSDRREPPCPFLPRCGGCDWQQVSYPAQLELKARLIASELSRAAGLAVSPQDLIVPAPAEFGYRSRIRLKTGAGGKLGFLELGTDRLVEIDRCLVAEQGILLDSAHALAAALGKRCREIEVVNHGRGQVLVAYLDQPPPPKDLARAQQMLDRAGAPAGIVLRAPGARHAIGDVMTSVALEDGLALEVEADAFSQINHAQNRRLVAMALELAELQPGTVMLDLFCGAGNFSLPAARRGADVLGVDTDPIAIGAASRNASRLGISSARFVAMEAAEMARFLRRAGYRPQVAILDPPRSGARELIELLRDLHPARVIYVSCNVSTLARDLRILVAGGYRFDRVRALDFFPNTHHVEIAARALD